MVSNSDLKPQSRRAFRPKTRTGCRTCKIRRIKCDEERPLCRRCVSTGRKCDGYELPIRNTTSTNRSIVPKDTSTTLCHYMISTQPKLDSDESTGFDYFRSRTVREISGCFTSDLWQSIILQISHNDRSILTSVIALGSLHLSLQKRILAKGNNAEGVFAVQQYGRAIRMVRHRIAAASGSEPIEAALICCQALIFASIEFLCCNPFSAMTHVQTGRRILFELQRAQGANSQQPVQRQSQSSPLMMQLSNAFARLDYDDTCFGDHPPAVVIRAGDIVSPLASISHKFATLEDAKLHLDYTLGLIEDFRGKRIREVADKIPSDMSDWTIRYCSGRAALRMLALQEHRDQLLDLRIRLNDWLSKLKLLQIAIPTEHNRRAAQLMELQHFTAWHFLTTCDSRKEMDNDKYIAEFTRINQLARDYIEGDSKAGSPMPSLPVFTIDTGVFPALVTIALHCRDSRIRREALDMLNGPIRQEGLWVGKIIAWFITRVVDIEESQAIPTGPYIKAANIPEHARFCDVECAPSHVPRFGRLVCARFRHELDGDLHIVEDIFPLRREWFE